MAVEIEKQDASLQLEINEFQTNLFLSTKEIDLYFRKKLTVEKCSILDVLLILKCSH